MPVAFGIDKSNSPILCSAAISAVTEEADRINGEWMEALAELTGVNFENLTESVAFDRAAFRMMTSED